MKPKLLLTMTPVILAALILTGLASGCGGNGSGHADSAGDDDIEIRTHVENTDTLPYFPLTAEGLGPVHVGMDLESLPPRVNGLYTTMTVEQGFECETVVFSNTKAPDTVTFPFTVLDFGQGKADVILLNDDQCGVNRPEGGRLTLSSPFAEVLSLPGVQARWEGWDGGGAWYWTWQGLWFQPSPVNPGEDLTDKLYDNREAPVASDFTPDVTIGYIGTGLPF